jgi:hypothetical protein
MKNNLSAYLLAAAAVLLFGYAAFAYDLPKWFPFNQEKALNEWQEKVFRGRVMYKVIVGQGAGHLLAKSDEASSGLLYKTKVDIIKTPMISWMWKVNVFPKKVKDDGKEGWIERDDYAARVYVIFPSWNFLNIKSLEYVWDENLPEGKILTSPYFGNIKLIVAESGRVNIGRWVFEERNVFADYKKAFGSNPPRYAGAVALMTDADNSNSHAEALYKNLKIGYKK